MIALLGLALGGCSTFAGKQAEEKTAGSAEPAEAVKPARADLPDVPLTPELLYKLVTAEIAGGRGELDIAVQFYVDAALQTRDPRVVERATRIAMFARDFKSALITARLWVSIEPDLLKARRTLARLLVATGDVPASVQAIHELIEMSANKETAFLDVVRLLSRETNRATVYAVMQLVVEDYPNNADAQYALARVAEQAGKLDDALAIAQRSLELKPGWVQVQQQYARILHLQGKTKEAADYLKQVLAGNGSLELRLNYARLLVEARQFEEARRQFEIVAEQSPGDKDILFALGVLALQSNDMEAAEQYLTRLAESGDRRIEAAYYLAQIAEHRKDYQQAIRWYSSVSTGEYAFESRMRVASLFAKQGNLDAALKHLDETSTRNTDQEIRVFLARGDAMREVGEYARGVEIYDAALAQYPDNHDLLYARALMAERVGKIDILISDLKKIIAKNPKHAHALNALGYTLADRTDKLDEAKGYIERAYALQPDDPAIIDSMGWLNYRLGNHEEALKYLTRAYDLNKDAEIAAHLGEVLWVMGEQSRARKVWSRGLEEAPNDRTLREVMKRLLP
jgi:tetratricopeptide (TPR) repeat protein